MRFAILHHTDIPSPHFDLLIETGPDDLLLTFRLEHWPVTVPIDVVRQSDHRRIYLDYEGPISGGRGRVRRVAAGEYACATFTPSTIDLTLQLASPLPMHLVHINADRWRLSIH